MIQMGVKRQIERKQKIKKSKESKKALKKIEETVSKIPDKCDVCHKEFDPKSDDQLDSWMVRVAETEILMFCDVCYVED